MTLEPYAAGKFVPKYSLWDVSCPEIRLSGNCFSAVGHASCPFANWGNDKIAKNKKAIQHRKGDEHDLILSKQIEGHLIYWSPRRPNILRDFLTCIIAIMVSTIMVHKTGLPQDY